MKRLTKKEHDDRAVEIALYMIENKSTIRQAADHFNLSRTTIYNNVTKRIYNVNKEIAEAVNDVIENNKNARYERGGLATKKKYKEGFRPKRKVR